MFRSLPLVVVRPLGRALFVVLVAALPAAAQTKPPLTAPDFGKWESLGFGAQLSADGNWLGYSVIRVNEENDLRVMSTAADTSAVRAAGRVPLTVVQYGTSLAFTPDSRWAGYLIGVSPAERDRAQENRRPVRTSFGLLDLATGQTLVIERIASFRFSGDGRFVALRAYPPEGKTTEAVDLVIRDLATGAMTSFGNVTEFAWSDRGASLAMTVETEAGTGNGVQLYVAAAGRHRVLESSLARYRSLAWRKNGDDVAVLRAATTSGWRDTTHAILAWTGASGPTPWRHLLEANAAGIAADRRITERRRPEWSDDGSAIAFGLRDRVASPDTTKKRGGEKVSDVEVWRAADIRVMPMQKAQERRDLDRSLLAVWRLADDRVLAIGTDLEESATLLHGWRVATESDVSPYPEERMFGRDRADVYVVDVASGERRRVVERVRHFYGGSPLGRRLAYYRDGQYWVVDVATGAAVNVTAGIPAVFADSAYDTPTDELPPFAGFGGIRWSADDRYLYLNDKYDVWQVAADGSGGTRLTDGAADRVVARLQILDRDAEGVDPKAPLYFTLTGERTKQTGFGVLRPRRPFERLALEDARLGRLAKADSADVFVLQRERFDDSPDLFVAGPALADRRQVTATNTFQADYAWGRAELVDYTTSAGKELQGALFYPAGFQAGTKYPMIVNPYEIRSTELHAYSVPSERSYYNVQAWTQAGYFVLLPDIVFRWREPGPSTVEALEAGVAAVVARGDVDPKRVGLVGHSWGGYEATYVPTRSRMFAASVAGAPLTDFISMMGAVHWTPGLPETQHWETGQARMEVPFWEDLDAHLRSSPAAKVNELATPMLMEFGDADGTVDFRQGVEFYNFARRAGKKDFILLVYPGEDHGLRKKENQIDYHRRIFQWFGHYLKGEPAPPWMTDGLPWLDRKRILEDAAPPRPATPPGR
ncbi:MAG: prolyl oligopeptidase family serine peptidase [Gemmatimonadales bacterium]